MIEKLRELGIVAVVRGSSHTEAEMYVKSSIEGGIKALELTYSIPDMTTFMKTIIEKYPDAVVGAGSVLNEEMAAEAIEAGAKYIVSPGYSKGVNDLCRKENILYIPGCMTITEIMNAMDNGNELVKLFPGELFGIKYIKSVKAPIPTVRIMPTGGVNIQNVVEWFENGVECVGVGSSLFASKNPETIAKLATEFVGKINDYRSRK